MRVAFTVPGRVGGWSRPRYNGKTRTFFKDAKTACRQDVVRYAAAQAMEGAVLLSGALKLEIFIYQHTPKSWSKKRKGSAHWITGKPDADNIAKNFADAMSHVVYDDDAQIADLHIVRRYEDGKRERIEVMIEELPTYVFRKISERIRIAA